MKLQATSSRSRFSFVWLAGFVCLALFLQSAAAQVQPCVSSQGSQSFIYCDFSITTGLQINDSAAAVNNGTQYVMRVAPANNFEFGSVFYTTPVSLLGGFQSNFTFQFTPVPETTPADGISFIIMAPGGSSLLGMGDKAVGFYSGGIGYGEDDGGADSSFGISNSLAIEIDTHQDPWDPATPHIAAMSCLTGNNSSHHGVNCATGSMTNPTIAISANPLPSNVMDGGTHNLAINYTTFNPACTSSCNNMTVTLDGNVVLSFAFDLNSIGLDANDDALVGLTGSTGESIFEDNDVLNWQFSETIQEPVSQTTPTTFNFSTPTTTLDHTVDFSTANNAGDLVYPLNDPTTIQIQSTNVIVPPATWPQYVTGGPLATSLMLPLATDNPTGSGGNGSLFVDLCSDPTLNPPALPSDANCPYSSSAAISDYLGILISASLETPEPQINNPANTGLTTALAHYEPPSATPTLPWSPSTINGTPNPACVNTLGTATNSAPQNCMVADIQQNFFGDPTQSGVTRTKGTFAMLFNVPMPLTTASINGTALNTPPANSYTLPSNSYFSLASSPLQLSFAVNPACPNPINTSDCTATGSANYNYFSPAPIAGETFQITNSTGVVVYPTSNPPAQATPPAGFSTTSVSAVTFSGDIPTGTLADGQYFLQWSATDNFGIPEQNVQYITTGSCPNPTGGNPFPAPCYQTMLFQAPFNVDSTPPTIVVNSVSSPIVYGGTVTFTFTCSDPIAADGAAASGINPTNGCVGGPSAQASPVTIPVTSAGPATFTITATDNAGNVTTLNQPYSVSQATQTITFTTNAPASEVYNGTFTVAATGGASGNPVQFSYAGSCTNVGATYTMTSGTGTCSIIANQAGNGNYSAAPPVTETVNATLAAQAITFTTNAPTSAAYGSNFTVAATGGASGNPVQFSYAGATYTMTSGTGACSVIANQAGNGNYSAAPPVTESTNATKANSSTSLKSSPNPSNVGQSVTISYTVTSGATGTVSVSASTGESCSGPLTASVGSCSITFNTTGPRTLTGTYSGDGNFAGSVSGGLAQSVVSPTATVSPTSINFGAVRRGHTVNQNVTLTNNGSTSIKITSVRISGGSDPDDFRAASHCGSSLAGGASCTITVYYSSDSDNRGGVTSSLVIADGASNSPQSVSLSGASD